LFAIYLQIVDDWFIYDNSNAESELIAQKNDIFNQEKWELLNKNQ
jgi:predicted ABC-type ATPase